MTEVFEGVAGAKFFAVKEATYGTGVIPAAADAIRHTSIRNAENRELVPLDEAGQGRSRPKAAIGRSSVGVEISTLWRPASAAGNPPEIDKLLENLFGTGAALAGSDMGYEYTLAADQVASIGCYYETNVAQEYWGGIALNELTLSLGGRDYSRAVFRGQGQRVARFTPFTAAAGQRWEDYLGVGNVISIDDAAAALVTAAGGDDGRTIAPTVENSDMLTSGLPDPTYGDVAPQYGTVGSLSLDGGSMDIRVLSAQVTINNGVILIDGEYGTAFPRGVISPARRAVNFSITLNAKAEDIRRLQTLARNVTYDTEVVFGPDDGRRSQLDMPQVQFAPSSPDRQIDQPSTINLRGQATSVAGSQDDEIKLSYF